ncbi:MAG: FtsX-like permease family protein, partial [Streptosporangiaceae bacterium]
VLGFFVVHGKPASPSAQVLAFVPGYLLIIVGLIIAGPWLTMAAARTMARRTRHPGTLIAARRLADDPKAAFRAVSGLVLALLITTAATVAISTQDAKDLTRWGTTAEADVVTNQLADQQFGGDLNGGNSTSTGPAASGSGPAASGSGPAASGSGPAASGSGPAASAAPLAARLSGIPGVHGLVVVRSVPNLSIPGTFQNLGANLGGPASPVPAGAVSCAQLRTIPALGRCPAGATAVAFPEDGFGGPLFGRDLTGITWPAVSVPAARLDTLRVDAVNVGTDGSAAAIERTRTVLENADAYASLNGPSTIGDLVGQDHSANNAYQQLANTVILISLPIAGCTLAAGIAGGLADRKRPFSLLRLTGARLAMLRRVVALEGAVPLLAVAVVAIATGFGGAAMNASLQQDRGIVAPGTAYYLLTAGGILAALGIIAATFPLLARITGPEVARNE